MPIDKAALAWMPKPVWGPIKWKELHTRALTPLAMTDEAKWLRGFISGLPCPHCRHHFEAFYRKNPPDLSSRPAFFIWTVKAHNAVNKATGKPFWLIERALIEHWALFL